MHPQQPDSLSWGDSFFLYLEREGQPLSIAGISEFEGKIPLKACRNFIESKLPLIPRYRQRVIFPPFNVGLPVWEFDPQFDIRNHINEVALEHGTETDLKETVSRILSTSLNRHRPLWDVTLIRGLKGNRTAMLTRIHHCLADGVAGVRLMNVLLDTTAAPPVIHRPVKFEVPQPTDSKTLLVDGIFRSYFSVVERLLKVQSEVLGAAQHVMAGGSKEASASQAPENCADKPSIPGLVELMTELGMPAERLPFNRVCQGPHQMGWTELPLPVVKAVKNVCGTTVNDVILAVLTSAVAKYARLHGVKLKGRTLRVVVPVNVRNGDDQEGLGNRITFLPISFPLDVTDPVKLLGIVHQKMCYYKNARIPELVSLAGTLAGAIPTALQAIAAPIASQLPLSVCNMICTNVPGPQVPLYLIGHKMTRWYPVVPIGGEMGVNCAVLSYDGMIFFGFHADVQAVPDVECMEGFLQLSFAELCEKTIGRQPETKATGRKPAAKRPRTKAHKPAETKKHTAGPAKEVSGGKEQAEEKETDNAVMA